MHEQIYLAHHGILGMKWGIRRYQNPDGTLTAAGKKRYGDDGSDERKAKKESIENEMKNVGNLSDDELRIKINRMQMEESYQRLLQSKIPKEPEKQPSFMKQLISAGKDAAKSALINAGKEQVSRIVKHYTNKAVEALIPSLKGVDVAGKITDIHGKPKDVKKMSDSDLKKYLERLKNEKKYNSWNGGRGRDDDDDDD